MHAQKEKKPAGKLSSEDELHLYPLKPLESSPAKKSSAKKSPVGAKKTGSSKPAKQALNKKR